MCLQQLNSDKAESTNLMRGEYCGKSGINKVISIGNLESLSQERFTEGIVTISLATSKFYKDEETEKFQDRIERHRVVFFDRLAQEPRAD
jgi:hypothetical protein